MAVVPHLPVHDDCGDNEMKRVSVERVNLSGCLVREGVV